MFEGSGVGFAEVREYVPSDGVRTVDRNVTTRTGTPPVERHVAQHELTVLLLVASSASGRFGNARRLELRTAAEPTALSGASTVRKGDRLGLQLFSGLVARWLPPRRDRHAVLRVIRGLPEAPRAACRAGRLLAFDHLLGRVGRGAVTFPLSDFEAGGSAD